MLHLTGLSVRETARGEFKDVLSASCAPAVAYPGKSMGGKSPRLQQGVLRRHIPRLLNLWKRPLRGLNCSSVHAGAGKEVDQREDEVMQLFEALNEYPQGCGQSGKAQRSNSELFGATPFSPVPWAFGFLPMT